MLNIDSLENLVSSVLEQLGLALYDLELKKEAKEINLRITVIRKDKSKGNVTIDSLSKANRELGAMLDLEDPIEERYRLIVESPGIERDLKTWQHFVFALGEKVHIVTRGTDSSKHTGELIAVNNEDKKLTLLSKEERKEIDFTDIKAAKTFFEWPDTSKPKKKF